MKTLVKVSLVFKITGYAFMFIFLTFLALDMVNISNTVVAGQRFEAFFEDFSTFKDITGLVIILSFIIFGEFLELLSRIE